MEKIRSIKNKNSPRQTWVEINWNNGTVSGYSAPIFFHAWTNELRQLDDADEEKITQFARKYIENSFYSCHGGKMKGIRSANCSSPLTNNFCKCMSKTPGTVCEHCFAEQYASFRTTLNNKLNRNAEIWTKTVIPIEFLPRIHDEIFRLNAFSECQNLIACTNYINLCRVNPDTTFAIWAKKIGLWEKAFKMFEKPKNLRFIYSSPMLNTVSINPEKYDFIDHVFTVYDKSPEYEDVYINCGARCCNTCRKCYMDAYHGPLYISELLK